jgi:hypothetical protein
MNQGMHKGLAGAWLLLVSGLVLAAEPVTPLAGATEKPAGELEELDEVVVVGGRLYDRIVKAEDKLYKLYNQLNKEDDFDINCASVPGDEGSRIETRFCMPAFFADAKAEQVRLSQYCLSLQEKDEDGNVSSNGVCYEPPAAEQLFFHRRDEYVDNMLKVVNADPDLRKMAQEVEKLHLERSAYEHRFDELRAIKVAERADKTRNKTTVR